MQLRNNQRVQICDSVLFQTVRDESVLLEMETQRYYGLDDVGTRVWTLLREFGSVNDVASHLQLEFDADLESLRSDVYALVQKMASAGLVKVTEVGS